MTSISPMWRITWFSSRAPLPPSSSRASAITWRALRVLLSLARPAIVSVSRPLSSRRGKLHAEELHAGHFGGHLDEPVLDDLEAAERLAELVALLAVGQGGLVGRDGVTEGSPRARRSGAGENAAGILERRGAG